MSFSQAQELDRRLLLTILTVVGVSPGEVAFRFAELFASDANAPQLTTEYCRYRIQLLKRKANRLLLQSQTQAQAQAQAHQANNAMHASVDPSAVHVTWGPGNPPNTPNISSPHAASLPVVLSVPPQFLSTLSTPDWLDEFQQDLLDVVDDGSATAAGAVDLEDHREQTQHEAGLARNADSEEIRVDIATPGWDIFGIEFQEEFYHAWIDVPSETSADEAEAIDIEVADEMHSLVIR